MAVRMPMWARLAPLVLLALVGIAHGEADQFLTRDGNVSSGATYLDSDGAVQAKEPAPSPWDTFVEGEEPPPERFELPGLWLVLVAIGAQLVLGGVAEFFDLAVAAAQH